MTTQSEALFTKYCERIGISIARIEETSNKTPDYELNIDGTIVIAEVKEIDRNPEERESERMLEQRGYGNRLSNTPGDRVRKKITSASPQLKARSQGRYATILVLFDRGRVLGHLDPYNIRVAMYGLEQIHIAVPNDYSVSPYSTGMSYGPKRKMTEEHNTSISAIGVLFLTDSNEPKLHIYHNKFASVPLPSPVINSIGIPQYKLEENSYGTTAEWEKINEP